MKKLKIFLVLFVGYTCVNAQSLKQSKISYGHMVAKQNDDCIRRNAVKTLQTKQIKFNEESVQMQLINSYPNPFGGEINIMVNYQQQGTVRLEAYNAFGACVFNSSLHPVNAGVSNISYDLQALSAGIYFFKVISFDQDQNVNQYSFKSIKIN